MAAALGKSTQSLTLRKGHINRPITHIELEPNALTPYFIPLDKF